LATHYVVKGSHSVVFIRRIEIVIFTIREPHGIEQIEEARQTLEKLLVLASIDTR
jgi:hypothetical protein